MNKLLAANFKRLSINKLYIIGIVFMFAVGIFMPIPQYLQALKSDYSVPELDKIFFAFPLFIAFISSAFCSVFIGTEYSDNTMRNKVCVGHKRIEIYFANLITCAVASITMCIAFIIPCLCIGIPLLGFFVKSTTAVIITVICCIFLTLAFTAIFTLIAMLSRSKTIGAIICIFLVLLLIMLGVFLQSALEQPENISPFSMSVNGEFVQSEQQPNPFYIGGVTREIYMFLLDFTPGGQTVQLAGNLAVNLFQMIGYSVIIFVLTTAVGIYLFEKKDLN